jgi:hypothetical protein
MSNDKMNKVDGRYDQWKNATNEDRSLLRALHLIESIRRLEEYSEDQKDKPGEYTSKLRVFNSKGIEMKNEVLSKLDNANNKDKLSIELNNLIKEERIRKPDIQIIADLFFSKVEIKMYPSIHSCDERKRIEIESPYLSALALYKSQAKTWKHEWNVDCWRWERQNPKTKAWETTSKGQIPSCPVLFATEWVELQSLNQIAKTWGLSEHKIETLKERWENEFEFDLPERPKYTLEEERTVRVNKLFGTPLNEEKQNKLKNLLGLSKKFSVMTPISK